MPFEWALPRRGACGRYPSSGARRRALTQVKSVGGRGRRSRERLRSRAIAGAISVLAPVPAATQPSVRRPKRGLAPFAPQRLVFTVTSCSATNFFSHSDSIQSGRCTVPGGNDAPFAKLLRRRPFRPQEPISLGVEGRDRHGPEPRAAAQPLAGDGGIDKGRPRHAGHEHHLEEAIEVVRWQDWRIGRRTSRDEGIPIGFSLDWPRASGCAARGRRSWTPPKTRARRGR